MPIEEFEEEGLKKLPNLELSQALFALQCKYASDVEKEKSKKFLEEEITKNHMAPFYQQVCNELKWSIDQKRLEAMVTENEKQLKELEEKITDAEENLGEIEIRDAYLNKAEYFVQIGDKEKSLKSFREAYEKTTTLGHKLDNVFMQIRVGFFFLDNDIITRNIEKAASLIEEGGDWDRRNRLKVYKGYYAITIRDFKAAATNFLESISTFTSYELMKYAKFVEYTVLVSIISLKRSQLGDKVVRGSEILECLYQLPVVRKCLNSLYECQYHEFFQVLIEVENILHNDRLFARHTAYYIREMRILAYGQLLESYRSLTLEYMANAFGISIEMLDRELAKFIAAGRLHCKIDKVGGVVETNRPDSKNYQYQAVIKQGDALLNRIQKLSRVINL